MNRKEQAEATIDTLATRVHKLRLTAESWKETADLMKDREREALAALDAANRQVAELRTALEVERGHRRSAIQETERLQNLHDEGRSGLTQAIIATQARGRIVARHAGIAHGFEVAHVDFAPSGHRDPPCAINSHNGQFVSDRRPVILKATRVPSLAHSGHSTVAEHVAPPVSPQVGDTVRLTRTPENWKSVWGTMGTEGTVAEVHALYVMVELTDDLTMAWPVSCVEVVK